MNRREQLIKKFKDATSYQYQEYAGAHYSTFEHNEEELNKCADIAEQYHTSLTPKPTDSAKEVLRVVSCNGMREMTDDRILEAMEQYSNDKVAEAFKFVSNMMKGHNLPNI